MIYEMKRKTANEQKKRGLVRRYWDECAQMQNEYSISFEIKNKLPVDSEMD